MIEQLRDVTSCNCECGYPRATFRSCQTLPAQPSRVARCLGQIPPTSPSCAQQPLTLRQGAASRSPRLSCSSGSLQASSQNPSRRVSRFWNAPTPDPEYSVSGAPESAGVDERSGQVCACRDVASIAWGPLPGPQDAETLMPPVARYWFRRVPGHNLWVYFAFDEGELIIVTVTARPPVPLTD